MSAYGCIDNQDDRDEAAKLLRRWRQERDKAHGQALAVKSDIERVLHIHMAGMYRGRIDGYREALKLWNGDY